MNRMLITLTLGMVASWSLNIGLLASDVIPFEQFDTITVNVDKDIDNSLDPDYFTIASVEIRNVENDDSVDKSDVSLLQGFGDIVLVVDKLMALGKKIWTVVEAGKPVVNARFKPISVLPYLAESNMSFLKMSNWSIPKTQTYEVIYKNLYGVTMVNFTFMITFQHDGTFKGVGKYLTGVNIIPSNISVAWGYKFDCKSELMAISNMGTMENPVAAATIQLDYTTSTPIKESRSSILFHVIGDGRIIKL